MELTDCRPGDIIYDDNFSTEEWGLRIPNGWVWEKSARGVFPDSPYFKIHCTLITSVFREVFL